MQRTIDWGVEAVAWEAQLAALIYAMDSEIEEAGTASHCGWRIYF
jgi:hypothetical protein